MCIRDRFDILADGTKIASFKAVNTGGWQKWTTLEAQQIKLEAGVHTLRICLLYTSFCCMERKNSIHSFYYLDAERFDSKNFLRAPAWQKAVSCQRVKHGA